MSGQIFISYRREDTQYPAKLIYDRLRLQFPHKQIFKDIDSLVPGDNFEQKIKDSLDSCEVLLAIIGRRWLSATDKEGRLRLSNEKDFVRLEVATALKRGILVIPVTVEGAPVPENDQLPDDLKQLSSLHAQPIDVGRHFETDVAGLVVAVERVLGKAQLQKWSFAPFLLVLLAWFFPFFMREPGWTYNFYEYIYWRITQPDAYGRTMPLYWAFLLFSFPIIVLCLRFFKPFRSKALWEAIISWVGVATFGLAASEFLPPFLTIYAKETITYGWRFGWGWEVPSFALSLFFLLIGAGLKTFITVQRPKSVEWLREPETQPHPSRKG